MTITDNGGHAPVDGQIDLFTGGAAETIEYGARHTAPDGDTVVVGPLRTLDGAQSAGDHATSQRGGTYELVTRRVTAWEPLT